MKITSPRFTANEEATLHALCLSGDREAADLLARSVLPWAMRCAFRFRGKGLSEQDLEEIAFVATAKAIRRHKPERGRLTRTVYWAVRSEFVKQFGQLAGPLCFPEESKHAAKQAAMARSPLPEVPAKRYEYVDAVEECERLLVGITRPDDLRAIRLSLTGRCQREVGEAMGVSKARISIRMRRAIEQMKNFAAGMERKERAGSAVSAKRFSFTIINSKGCSNADLPQTVYRIARDRYRDFC